MPALLGYSPYSYAAVPAFWVLAVLPWVVNHCSVSAVLRQVDWETLTHGLSTTVFSCSIYCLSEPRIVILKVTLPRLASRCRPMSLTTPTRVVSFRIRDRSLPMCFQSHLNQFVHHHLAIARLDDEKIVEKAGAEKVTLIQKLDAASANGMENLPLFAAAVILSALAKVPEEQTAASAKMVLLFRAIYPIAYVAGKNQALSFLRTGAYLGSIFYILQM